MLEIIPSILAQTPQEFKDMVRKLEPHTNRAHLDIGDGIFVPNKTISGYNELNSVQTNLRFDVHLMVENPIGRMYEWYKTGAAGFFVHAENFSGLRELLEQIRLNNRTAGLVLNPETRPEDVAGVLDMVDIMQFMTVHPGFYGSQFLPEVLSKISDFHEQYPEIKVAVDGGINLETARQAVAAGADILVVGSYIMNSPDPGKAISDLQNLRI